MEITYTKFECRHDGKEISQSIVSPNEVLAALKSDLQTYSKMGFPFEKLKPLIKPLLKIVKSRKDLEELLTPLAQTLTQSIQAAIEAKKTAVAERQAEIASKKEIARAFSGGGIPDVTSTPRRIKTAGNFESTSAAPMIVWNNVWIEFAEWLGPGLLSTIFNIIATYAIVLFVTSLGHGLEWNEGTEGAVRWALLTPVFFWVKEKTYDTYVLNNRATSWQGCFKKWAWKYIPTVAYKSIAYYCMTGLQVTAVLDTTNKIVNPLKEISNGFYKWCGGTGEYFQYPATNTLSAFILYGGLVTIYYVGLPLFAHGIKRGLHPYLKKAEVEVGLSAIGLALAGTSAMYLFDQAGPLIGLTKNGKSMVVGLDVPQDYSGFYENMLKKATSDTYEEGWDEMNAALYVMNTGSGADYGIPTGVQDPTFYQNIKSTTIKIIKHYKNKKFRAVITDGLRSDTFGESLFSDTPTTFLNLPREEFNNEYTHFNSASGFMEMLGEAELLSPRTESAPALTSLFTFYDADVKYFIAAGGGLVLGFFLKRMFWDKEEPTEEYRFKVDDNTEEPYNGTIWVSVPTTLKTEFVSFGTSTALALIAEPTFVGYELSMVRQTRTDWTNANNIRKYFIIMDVLRRMLLWSGSYYLVTHTQMLLKMNIPIGNPAQVKIMAKGGIEDLKNLEDVRSGFEYSRAVQYAMFSALCFIWLQVVDNAKNDAGVAPTSASFRDRTTSSK